MKVLAITSHGYTLNAVRPEAELLIGLKRAGVDLTVMTQSDSVYIDRLRDAGVELLPYMIGRKFSPPTMWRLRRLLKREAFDLVYAFNNKAICNTAFARIGLPVKLMTYRGQTGNIHRFDPASYLTHLHPSVDGILCVADEVRKSLVAHVGVRKKLYTVYKGHDLSWYNEPAADRAVLNLRDDQFVIGCVANNRPRKGVDYLIRACAQLKDIEHLQLLLIGKGMDEATLGDFVEQQGLTGRVTLAGHRTDATALIQCCDVSVLPATRREGLPKTVIEAMVYGVAPIVTDTGGNAELVQHGHNGLVVPVEDSSALANAIRQLHADPELRARFGDNSRARIDSHFNVRDSVRNTLAAFREHVTS
ncbi:MAG: glycosyltransferase [Pseudomonadota bacterium]